jgi:pimeloyl-ACP methyl ester carboxylesterase
MHSRHWKMQIPYLARHCRVLTFDGRGNGRSDRPTGAEAYRPAEFTADALAVMDTTGTERAVLVTLSLGATPPPRCDATPATPPASSHCWASQAREPDTPAPWRDPGAGAKSSRS